MAAIQSLRRNSEKYIDGKETEKLLNFFSNIGVNPEFAKKLGDRYRWQKYGETYDFLRLLPTLLLGRGLFFFAYLRSIFRQEKKKSFLREGEFFIWGDTAISAEI